MIDRRGLVYAPMSENGVVFLFELFGLVGPFGRVVGIEPHGFGRNGDVGGI